ncbi:predicted protein [Uncinocarpus reesii 1704]|uniref:Uncharacterized protein n=1 Tax=Uncinocarpus reesii (strain UAMH 1704) TaxID=336963 RepID=C4JJH0_UNCRE|nr:uncharacterized protein UREG_01777 [Uncinocarpus reesii 1704]EEP76928.1 predicted protein [Uncinocarpus reesii 1704]
MAFSAELEAESLRGVGSGSGRYQEPRIENDAWDGESQVDELARLGACISVRTARPASFALALKVRKQMMSFARFRSWAFSKSSRLSRFIVCIPYAIHFQSLRLEQSDSVVRRWAEHTSRRNRFFKQPLSPRAGLGLWRKGTAQTCEELDATEIPKSTQKAHVRPSTTQPKKRTSGHEHRDLPFVWFCGPARRRQPPFLACIDGSGQNHGFVPGLYGCTQSVFGVFSNASKGIYSCRCAAGPSSNEHPMGFARLQCLHAVDSDGPTSNGDCAVLSVALVGASRSSLQISKTC